MTEVAQLLEEVTELENACIKIAIIENATQTRLESERAVIRDRYKTLRTAQQYCQSKYGVITN